MFSCLWKKKQADEKSVSQQFLAAVEFFFKKEDQSTKLMKPLSLLKPSFQHYLNSVSSSLTWEDSRILQHYERGHVCCIPVRFKMVPFTRTVSLNLNCPHSNVNLPSKSSKIKPLRDSVDHHWVGNSLNPPDYNCAAPWLHWHTMSSFTTGNKRFCLGFALGLGLINDDVLSSLYTREGTPPNETTYRLRPFSYSNNLMNGFNKKFRDEIGKVYFFTIPFILPQINEFALAFVRPCWTRKVLTIH